MISLLYWSNDIITVLYLKTKMMNTNLFRVICIIHIYFSYNTHILLEIQENPGKTRKIPENLGNYILLFWNRKNLGYSVLDLVLRDLIVGWPHASIIATYITHKSKSNLFLIRWMNLTYLTLPYDAADTLRC